ncbi:hypothetical protein [Flavobacterium sp. J27]|uniref:hypothetical protein n=1 Tax=Flavobacterium sp. J27 TaxID=2060419 RepID=UPI0010306140|nr:hypothetical protein [Flavobacterium sp. J27]
MLPIDHEFVLLYILYGLLCCYIIYKIVSESKRNKFRFISYLIISLSLNGFLFYDVENFKGGGSLVVLFSSGVLLLFTFVTFVFDELVIN